METTVASLTVFFEDPFWVAVYQREEGGGLQAARVVFGKEPKDYEVYAFFLDHWKDLRFGPPVPGEAPPQGPRSPKRMQRQVNRQLQAQGVGTKAQQALKLQQEAGKKTRALARKARAEEEKQRLYALRQQKKKEKHRGR